MTNKEKLELELTSRWRSLASQWVASGQCQSEDHAYHEMQRLSGELIVGVTITADANRVVHIEKWPSNITPD